MTRNEIIECIARSIAYAEDRPHTPGIPTDEMRRAIEVERNLEAEGLHIMTWAEYLEMDEKVARLAALTEAP